MQSSMTLSTIGALFCAMTVLAAIPSISVLAVSTRSTAFGFIHGVFTTLGIVVGDIIFINGDRDFTDFGTIEILLLHKKFQYSYWSDNHGTARMAENYLTICYTLHETDNKTNLELEHKN